MTKVALCYYGALGGRNWKDGMGGAIHPSEGFESVKAKLILANPDVSFDIFVHSWSVVERDGIVDTLNPTSCVFEHQKSFVVEALKHEDPIFDLKDLLCRFSAFLRSRLSNEYKVRHRSHKFKAALRLYSRWYSTKNVLLLKQRHEAKIGVEYDYVMLLRFDMEFLSSIYFSVLNPSYFYASGWFCGTQLGRDRYFDRRNLQDYWFISNSGNMDIFGALYDFLPEYTACSHRASFQHAKRFFTEKRIRYIKALGDDYELIRRVRGTEKY